MYCAESKTAAAVRPSNAWTASAENPRVTSIRHPLDAECSSCYSPFSVHAWGEGKSHRVPVKVIQDTFMERGIENSVVSDNPSVDTVGRGKLPDSALKGLLPSSCNLADRLAMSSCPADKLKRSAGLPQEKKPGALTGSEERLIRCMARGLQTCSTGSISKVSVSVKRS